jgi:hypothetical protein
MYIREVDSAKPPTIRTNYMEVSYEKKGNKTACIFSLLANAGINNGDPCICTGKPKWK